MIDDAQTGGAITDPRPSSAASAGYEDTSWGRARRWRPSRRGAGVALLLLIALVALMLTSNPRTGYLDPAAVDPSGSRAVATVLGDQGVTVLDARTTEEVTAGATDATVLVTDATLISIAMLNEVLDAEPARLILVEPPTSSPTFERLAAGLELSDTAGDDPVAPRCQLPVATRAGDAVLPGSRYDARAWATSGAACYDSPESAALVVIPPRAGRPEVVLVGSAHPLTNDGFDEQGNAALALGLLGSRPDLVWWRPIPTDPALAGQANATPVDLMPGWVVPVLLQALVACLLVVWWRARRLGRLVVEQLPVVVRAGETTAGHARLLHAHHARAEAAVHLRARAHERIRVRLALPVNVSSTRLATATAHRTGRPPEQVAALLYGPEPTTDAQLVALGHELDVVMVEVGGA